MAEHHPAPATDGPAPVTDGPAPVTDEPAPADRPGTAGGPADATPPVPHPAGPRSVLIVGALVLALIAGFALGRVGQRGAEPGPDGTGTTAGDHAHPPGTGPHPHGEVGINPTDTEVGGVSLSAAGYTLMPAGTSLRPGVGHDFTFQVRGPDGQPVTRFEVVHDKQLHLIVARRDLTGYQHLHPSMAPDGTWRVPLTLPGPGSWRAYADFTALDPADQPVPVILAVDLAVAGSWIPRALPEPAREAEADGYQVSYEGDARVAASAPLVFRVSRRGAPVQALERYLGAYGHLVMLREGDLAYVHVHPDEASAANGSIRFWLAAPSPGRYRMYLDFQVAGEVRTAEFTLTVP